MGERHPSPRSSPPLTSPRAIRTATRQGDGDGGGGGRRLRRQRPPAVVAHGAACMIVGAAAPRRPPPPPEKACAAGVRAARAVLPQLPPPPQARGRRAPRGGRAAAVLVSGGPTNVAVTPADQRGLMGGGRSPYRGEGMNGRRRDVTGGEGSGEGSGREAAAGHRLPRWVVGRAPTTPCGSGFGGHVSGMWPRAAKSYFSSPTFVSVASVPCLAPVG